MANLIQIKRAITTATPTSLANGELAYSGNTASDSLFIGNPNGGAVTRIGGEKFGHVHGSTVGQLTANAVLIANSGGFINTIKIGNTTVNAVTNSTSLALSNSSAAIVISIPSAAVISNGQFYLNANGSYSLVDTSVVTAGSNTQIFFNDSGFINASSGFTFNKTSNTLTVSNTFVAAIANVSTSVNSAMFTVGTSFIANTTGIFQIGVANISTSVYSPLFTAGSSDFIANTTAIVSTGFANITGSVNSAILKVGSNFIANTTGAFHTGTVNAAVVSSTNASVSGLLNVTGNTDVGDNSSDSLTITARIDSNVVPIANVTHDLGTTALRWNGVYASNVVSVDGYFDGSVQIVGNLTVSGNVTTTNVQSVIISDPLIILAGNNTIADSVDIGFVGNYYDGSERHTGLFRDATDGLYKLFANTTQQLETTLTVNTADPTFALATLNARLNSGGFVSNATHVAITANSTVNVAIAANTLSLSTALLGNSGGTGLSSYTNQDILVANTTNGFNKLTLGSDGYVLQSNGSALVYATLDGGTF
jgi:hypothetical protein